MGASREDAVEVGLAGQLSAYAVEVVGCGHAASGEGDRRGAPRHPRQEGVRRAATGGQAVEQAGEHAVAGAHGGQGCRDRRPGVRALVGRDEQGAVAAEADGDDVDAAGDELAGGVADVAPGSAGRGRRARRAPRGWA